MKVFESEKTLAFLDINPLSFGHAVRPISKQAQKTVTDRLFL